MAEPRPDPCVGSDTIEHDIRTGVQGFGTRLEAAQWAAQVELLELAARTGISTTTLSRYRVGRQAPSLDAVTRIREALGCLWTDLLGHEPPGSVVLGTGHVGSVVDDQSPEETGPLDEVDP